MTAGKLALVLALLLSLLAACNDQVTARSNPATGQQAQPRLPTSVLTIKGLSLVAEVARTPSQRQAGLSFRETLGSREAMLFVYQSEQMLHFTMQHAGIPLSIAFISEDGVIVDIQTMTPFTVGPYSSKKPARYALEVNQGWFANNNIQPGDRVSFAQNADWLIH